LTDKINAAVISDPSSEVISNGKGVPEAIKFSATAGIVRGEISE
jgi:hypothetical protein